jgi:type VI secretion system secreted protein VgrG
MSYVEGNRFLYLDTPLGANKLLLQSFTGNEGLSRLFDFQLELLAENKTTVNFDQLIGQKVSFGIQGAEKTLGARHFNGIVVELSQGDRDQDFTSYSMRVVPDIWRLTRKFQSRIFQHLSVPDILKKVLDGYDVVYQIQGTFEPRDYCTQYRETDFNFLSRLTEAEGIYYFFKFAKGSHQLVVANMPSSHPDTANPTLIFESVGGGVREDERITDWQKEQFWGPGKYTTWDHHFQLPHRKLQGQETAGITVQAGKVSHKLGLAGNDKLEIYDYPATYAHRFDGINKSGGEQPDDLQKISPDAKRSVGLWMQQQEAAMLRIQAAGNCRSITAGYKFTLQRHFNGDGQYVITRATHAAGEGDFRSAQNAGRTHYSNSFECIPFALPFRPPQASQRPIIAGPQTAVVVGPSGEEIFTDKYGRVKVQFHWDRDGKYDGDSSCWLRVATMWAGKQWGSVFLPRIGHEVIVGFIEGDPDRPVIVGSVYNADTMPPYELPANKTRSGIKSDSSMGSGGFNEIRFEDLKGKEQIFIHGQKDSDTRIENDCREWIGEDRHLIVKRDRYEEVDRDVHLKVTGNHKEAITGNRHLAVSGNEALQVSGNHSFQVSGNVATQFTGNHAEQTTGSYYLQAQSIVLEAETALCLTVGSNFISILPAGIFINGMPMVNINSGGAAVPGIPGMPESPNSPGTAIEADKAVAGSEVTYSADSSAASASSSAAPAPAAAPPMSADDKKLEDIKALLNKSATGKDAVKYLADSKVPIKFADGNGSYWDGTQIVISRSETAKASALTLVHEIHHARSEKSGTSADIAKETRSDYVKKEVEEESVGTVKSIQTKNELVAAGEKVDETFPLEAQYNKAYADAAANAKKTNPDATPAQLDQAGQQAGLDAVRKGFNDGSVVTSNTNEKYPDYYGKSWDDNHK